MVAMPASVPVGVPTENLILHVRAAFFSTMWLASSVERSLRPSLISHMPQSNQHSCLIDLRVMPCF